MEIKEEFNKIEKQNNYLDNRKIIIESRRLALLYPEKEDMEKLLEWRNEKTFLDGCTHRDCKITMREFAKELENDFNFDRHFQTVVYSKKGNNMVGTLWSYKFNEEDSSVYVSTYIDKENQNKSLGVEAFSDFIKYLFENENIDKIYTEVYSNNKKSLSAMLSGGFEKLDVDKSKKRIKKGEDVEVVKLVLDKNNVNQMERFDEIIGFFKNKK